LEQEVLKVFDYRFDRKLTWNQFGCPKRKFFTREKGGAVSSTERELLVMTQAGTSGRESRYRVAGLPTIHAAAK
jgi:hypothetical protein